MVTNAPGTGPIDPARLSVQFGRAVTGVGTNLRLTPASTKNEHRVAITGGNRKIVTMAPLTAPTAPPSASTIGTAINGLPRSVLSN